MATSLTVDRLPTPAQIARGAASALPSEISRRPAVGICGVVIGAGVVTLTGRLLGLGLDDLKGRLGLGYDAGAWISTTFNTSLMFIGPITVYLGGLLGARRVLLSAAPVFALTCVCMLFIHSYSLLITALAVAGLAAGTFYPLTMTFALRNMPARVLPFTLALYATAVDGAVNIAPSVYGWCRDHGWWQGMWWIPALVTLVMMVCIDLGIPAPPPRPGGGPKPRVAGFLYASTGLAMIFAGLDQGQRLDWWRSGVVTGLVVGGSLLVVVSLVRLVRRPNPLVDVPYLRQWNILLLVIALVLFRFNLLSTIILVPQSLGIQGFLADQIGPAVIGTAAPQLLIACIVALMLRHNVDSRLIMALGFAGMAWACSMNADVTSAWSASNYYRSELLMAVGQSFAFLGLVATIVLQAIFSGGLARPLGVLTFSALFHLTRLFGGQVGVWFMTHFVAVREQFHSNALGLYVQQGRWVTDATVRQMAAGLSSRSPGMADATGRAVGLLNDRVRLQANVLAVADGFHVLMWSCVVALLLIALLRRSPMQYGELGAVQEAVQHS
jgi:MFS transporter, DHA2 family, multidrug resistance protein